MKPTTQSDADGYVLRWDIDGNPDSARFIEDFGDRPARSGRRSMTPARAHRPQIGLSVVLAVYWVPVLVGLRWGIWAGSDLIEIA